MTYIEAMKMFNLSLTLGKYARVLVPGKLSQPSLMLADQGRSLPLDLSRIDFN